LLFDVVHCNLLFQKDSSSEEGGEGVLYLKTTKGCVQICGYCIIAVKGLFSLNYVLDRLAEQIGDLAAGLGGANAGGKMMEHPGTPISCTLVVGCEPHLSLLPSLHA
jgi:hypothetical protein